MKRERGEEGKGRYDTWVPPFFRDSSGGRGGNVYFFRRINTESGTREKKVSHKCKMIVLLAPVQKPARTTQQVAVVVQFVT